MNILSIYNLKLRLKESVRRFSELSIPNKQIEMDYVPAHGDTTRKDDRDEISGVRVLDGEDQGKCISLDKTTRDY